MEASKFTFVVVVDAPAGVSMGEVASHLADASRLTAAGYDTGDPMARLGPIEVLGGVPSAELSAAI